MKYDPLQQWTFIKATGDFSYRQSEDLRTVTVTAKMTAHVGDTE